MALVVNTYGDIPQQPANYSDTYVPDQLIAGNLKLVTQPIVIPSGGPYPRGTVLGRVTDFSVVSAAALVTGNGTIGSISAGTGVLQGVYTLTATSATNFTVTDPEGTALAAATVGSAYSHNGIAFTITAGTSAFAAGDAFTLDVINSIGNFVLCLKGASDGSQVPAAILVDYADASVAPVTAGGYFMGEFNANAINYDSSWTVQQLAAAMPVGLFLKGAVIAADPGTATPAIP